MSEASTDMATAGMRRLGDLGARLQKTQGARIDLTEVEQEVRAALDEVGREMMATALAAADVDEPEVYVNGVLHGRLHRRRETIHTTFGEVQVEQTVYGRGRGQPTVVPMEKQLGLVERYYTPKCAKVLCHLTAVVVREEAVGLLRELGGIAVGEATMHRLPLKLMARYERDREVIEPVLRQRSQVPEAAAVVQIGLDGVMVPQDGEHCEPRGREPTDGDPDPPRHERAYGIVTPPGPAACDSKMGIAWHEASVGTLAYFDAEGEHLSTVYVGRMPEEKKATLTQMLKAEAQHALGVRPDLVAVLASDGALGQWESLAEITAELPEISRDNAVWLLDFHHATSHLQDACDVIDRKGSAAAQVRRHELCETLKAYDDGARRVSQRLRHYRRKARSEKAREELDSVIGYLDNNKARMSYKTAIGRNLPIATGPTEAAAKTLVGVRMKRSGARFSQHGGQTVLSLRAALKSRRFDDLMDILGASYKGTVTKRAA
jgi:hypothetical protein